MSVPAVSPEEEARVDRICRLKLTFVYFNSANWTLCLGMPLILLATFWGANSLQIGILTSFIYIFTPVQIFATTLLGRFGYRRLMVSGWSTRNLFLLPIPIMIFVTGLEPAPWKIHVLIACFGCFAFLRSVALVAQTPWMYTLIPEHRRGRFFSLFIMFISIGGASMLVVATIILFLMGEKEALGVIFTISLACGFVSAFVLAKLPDGPRPASMSVRKMLQLSRGFLQRASTFRRALMAWAVASGFIGAFIPFLSFYLISTRILDEQQAMILALVNFIGGILGGFLSRSWLDYLGVRFSIFLVTLTTSLLMVGLLTLILFQQQGLLHDTVGFVGFMLVAGGFGLVLTIWFAAGMKMKPYFTEEPTRPLQITLFQSIGAFTSGVCSMVWGALFRDTGLDGEPTVNLSVYLIYLGLIMVIFPFVGWVFLRLPIQEAVPRPLNYLIRRFGRKVG